MGDITKLKVDVIVNAANSTLLGGGGVDGAIHRGAGPELAEYCAKLAGCETGRAKISPGFDLPADWIVHTVGPIWRDDVDGETQEALLGACYANSLQLAHNVEASSIAFPSISTGAYSFPTDRAAHIAVAQCKTWLEKDKKPHDIILCCFPSGTEAPIQAALAEAYPQ